MKRCIKIIYIWIALSFTVVCSLSPQMEVQAYTQEEKQMVKDWLSANGYPPTWDGVYQAYQDYLDGKFDYMFESQTEAPPETEIGTTAETEKKQKKKKKASERQGSEESETQSESVPAENSQTKQQEDASEIPPAASQKDVIPEETEESESSAVEQKIQDGKGALLGEVETESETETVEIKKTASLQETDLSEKPAKSESRTPLSLYKVLAVFALAALVVIAVLFKRRIRK